MSLSGALSIGKRALSAQQAALQVTSNNISNSGNADYTRQVAITQVSADQQYATNIFMGTGLDLVSIQRQVDDALESRIRTANSDQQSSDVTNQWLSQVESVFNALGDDSLSTRLGEFFSSWSSLAAKPQDTGLRQVVIQDGQSVASWLQSTRKSLSDLQNDADQQLKDTADNANQIAQQIADLNGEIVTAEGGGQGQANGLRDQRDAALRQLSQLMDISTVQQDNGVVNVYVGSEPLVYNTLNRGVAVKQVNTNGSLTTQVVFKQDGGTMKLSSGKLGALSDIRTSSTQGTIDQLDNFTGQLIYQLNKIHSSGQGLEGLTNVTGTNAVDDQNAALDTSAAGLKFPPANGSFVVHITNKITGVTTSELVNVNLDGTSSGMSLKQLSQRLSNIAGGTAVTASVVGGKLQIVAQGDNEISFSQDSSGVLASVGINTFFTGSSANDIAVNDTITGQPALLAAAQNGEVGDNKAALAIAQLTTQKQDTLGGASLDEYLQGMMNSLGVKAANAKTSASAAQSVLDTLNAQRESTSGVSTDEEAINLMQQQRAYQGAARLITVVDELMQTIINMK